MILKIARPMSNRFHLGLAVFCIHLLAAPSWSQATLHILIAADTSAEGKVGEECIIDSTNIKEFFSEPSNIPANKKKKITFLTGAPRPTLRKERVTSVPKRYSTITRTPRRRVTSSPTLIPSSSATSAMAPSTRTRATTSTPRIGPRIGNFCAPRSGRPSSSVDRGLR